jgi:hypothetical protein
LVVSAAVKKIKKINGSYQPIYWYAPPDLCATDASTGKSQVDFFWNDGEGIHLTISKNAVEAGCSALAEWLHPYEYSDPVTGETRSRARLTICDNCTALINHISQIKADEAKPNRYDTDPHYLTHNVDAIRYWAVMRTYPSVPPLLKEKRYSFDEGIDRRSEGSIYD